MFLESTTQNPVYCSNQDCGIFVPPAQYYQGPDIAACRAWGSMTCRICRNTTQVGEQPCVIIYAALSWSTRPRSTYFTTTVFRPSYVFMHGISKYPQMLLGSQHRHDNLTYAGLSGAVLNLTCKEAYLASIGVQESLAYLVLKPKNA